MIEASAAAGIATARSSAPPRRSPIPDRLRIAGERRARAAAASTSISGDYAGSQVKRTLAPPCVQVTNRASEWMSRLAVQLKPLTVQVRCGPIGDSGLSTVLQVLPF